MLLQGVLACAMSAASHLVHGSSPSSHCGRAGKIEPIQTPAITKIEPMQTPAVADVSGDVDSSLILKKIGGDMLCGAIAGRRQGGRRVAMI